MTYVLKEGDLVLCPFRSVSLEDEFILFRRCDPEMFRENFWKAKSGEECLLMAESEGISTKGVLELPFEADIRRVCVEGIAVPFFPRNPRRKGA